MLTQLALILAGIAGAMVALMAGVSRLALSRAKHPSLTGHVRWGKRLAGFIPFYEYDQQAFYRSDDAPAEVIERRQAGFRRLAALYAERFPRSRAATAEAKGVLSDLQFVDLYRVPFQYGSHVRAHLGAGSFFA